jgi:hypothetical protein
LEHRETGVVFLGENDVFHAGKRSKFCLDVGLTQFRIIQEDGYIFYIVKRGQELNLLLSFL